MPASSSASAAGRRSPSASRTSPSPISASAQWASGARSPEQPRLPNSGTTGVMPAVSSAASVSAVSTRMPVCPVARVDSRSSIIARTTSRSTSGPAPAACERMSDRWSCARIGSGCAGWPGHRSRWRSRTPGWARPRAPRRWPGRARSRRPRRPSSSTWRVARATETTSSKETAPVPTKTCVMGPFDTRRQGADKPPPPRRPRRPSSAERGGCASRAVLRANGRK